MKPKLQDQLTKLHKVLAPIMEVEELLDAVDKAEARLVDLKAATAKAEKERQRVVESLNDAIDAKDQKLAYLSEIIGQKEAERDQVVAKANQEASEAWEKHRQVMAEIAGKEQEGWQKVNTLEEQAKQWDLKVRDLQKKHQEVEAKIAALKESL